ncbi:MAG TPA: response regulator [Planctomycetes bacterium]|nr:response regulator [Planctomycetota bacterium]HIK62200.1 response regulator [Planctomycetota bacterium]
MDFSLSKDLLRAAFPFHFVLDETMSLVDVGPGLQGLNAEMVPGSPASDWLTLQRPAIGFDFHSLTENSGLAFMIGCRAVDGLVLRGQVLHDPKQRVLFFLGGPRVANFAEMRDLGLGLRDLPPHDSMGDMLVLLETKQAALVDAQKLTEKLTMRRKWFQALIGASNDVVGVLDTHGRVQYLSPGIERLRGIPSERLVGELFLDWIHEEEAAAISAVLNDGNWGPDAGHHQLVHLKDSHGIIRTLDLSLRNMADDQHVGGIVINLSDVTDRLELRQQLLQVQRLDTLGQLAGGIAHDFNNLLFVIISYAALLKNAAEPGGSDYDDLDEILKAANDAADLTRQILTFSRKQDVDSSVLSLRTVIDEMMQMLGRLVGDQYPLRTRTEGSIGLTSGDEAQLRQVIINIVVNARDSMPDGGEILIDLEDVETNKPSLDCIGSPLPPGAYIVCTVTDNGTGMSKEVLDRAFEPFYTTKGRGKGTGLGLATVYGMVAEHGGGIFVDTAVGRGTQFSFWLPSCDSAEPTVIEPSSSKVSGREIERILVVDDSKAILKVVERVLGERGYDITTKSRPIEALELLQHEQVDLMLVDILMPEMNGMQLVEKALAQYPDIKVLMMTGYSTTGILKQVDEAELPVLWKPFTPSALLEKVREVLDGKVEQTPG